MPNNRNSAPRTVGRVVNHSPLILSAVLAILVPPHVAAQFREYQVLYSFQAAPDGAQPLAGLTIGADGVLYGTTNGGGAFQLGTIFVLRRTMISSMSSAWKETVLHSFSGPDGQSPQSTLVSNGALTFYGSTTAGGSGGGGGVIYELAPPVTAGDPWTETVLHNFPDGFNNPNNVTPNGILISPLGTLFTTTQGQSINGPTGGLVIALAPPATPGAGWTEFQLYSFGELQGELPVAGLVSEGGSLFGTTFFGGGGE